MNKILTIAAINGFIVVMFGAFGAHGLENLLSESRMATWQTGVLYHMFHTLALLGTGVLLRMEPGKVLLARSAWLFTAGIILFSGSLYLLAVTGITWLGMITPLGGLAFLAGWAALACAFIRGQSRG